VALEVGQRTGVLEVVSDEVTTLLYFQDGRLVFAEQGTLGETLGRVLLREGKLDQRQYARVIDHMTAALIDSEQMRFGEAAVALGFLRPDEVSDALATQVRRKLLCCFQWERVRMSFDPGTEALGEVAHFPSEVLPLVCEGIRRHWDLEQAERVLAPHTERYPMPVESPGAVSERLRLHPAESRFLRRLDGSKTVAQLLASSDLDSLLLHQLVAALVVTSSVRLADEPVASEGRGAPSKRGPSRREPETSRHPGARAAAQRLAAQLARRRRQQVSTSSIPPMDEQRARLEAERAYQRGVDHMGYEAWHPAARELRRAVKRCPDVVEYELLAAWAEHRATPPADERQAEAARARLAGLATRALKQDRENAFAWHVEGQLAAMEDDEPRALKCFRIAHRLDPNDREAERRIRLLSRRLEPRDKKK